MRFLSATQVFDGTQFLQTDSVLVLDDANCLLEISDRSKIDPTKIEFFDGIICPGFVNAHCHTELSYLHQHIQQKTGFTGFATELIAKRFTFSKEAIAESIKEAEQSMWNNGIVAVGDISNAADSFEMKANSKIVFHTFIELLALNPALVEKVMPLGLELQAKIKNHTSTLVPHAPYSVSAELMQAISKSCGDKLPITIHNQESRAENEFFEKGTGKVLDLYKQLNLDISYYQPSGRSSLQTYLKNLPANKNLILVHNTFTAKADMEFAEAYSKNIYWCLCPNANLYIENTLPDLNLFLSNNCKMVIGTDSLASNHKLSVIDELNTLLANFKNLNASDLLKWATSNGAQALNMSDKVGRLMQGKNSGLNHIRFSNNQFSFEKKLA